jgi:repressor LexA
MRSQEPTKRQLEVLNYIRRCVRDNGFPPTLHELCREFGFSSTNAASNVLRALERKGQIRRSFKGASRGIMLSEPLAAPAARQTAAKNLVIIADKTSGDALEVFLQPQGQIAVDGAMFGLNDKAFAARVHDFAMKTDGIFKGDIVIAVRDAIPAEGDIVVALVGGTVIVREWRSGAKFPELRASVRTFPTFPANEVNPILGVVVGVVRPLRRAEL